MRSAMSSGDSTRFAAWLTTLGIRMQVVADVDVVPHLIVELSRRTLPASTEKASAFTPRTMSRISPSGMSVRVLAVPSASFTGGSAHAQVGYLQAHGSQPRCSGHCQARSSARGATTLTHPLPMDRRSEGCVTGKRKFLIYDNRKLHTLQFGGQCSPVHCVGDANRNGAAYRCMDGRPGCC